MGEIKSVKVDNWGVFFLQKLQNFFNKTDYCDLTLQFRDNSQLKVHRLVLSACTDYFNVLEQTCEMVDDALIMPNELQADVVVPIVNFMYTGTLEFELKMYGKLLRTAKDMNMTVLLKLLEAHRRTMEGVNRLQRPPTPKTLRRHVPPATSLPAQQPRRVLTSPNSVTGIQRRTVQTKTISTSASTSANLQSQPQFRQQIGATSLIRTSVSSNTTTMQGRMQYVNQPAHETQQTVIKQEPEEITPTSPFEQLRKGYNNNKRPANNALVSPPAKKLNIEDVKEFAEQQRMRKQIAAEYGDDQGEYENAMMEDDIHNDDDDDDLATTSANSSATAGMQASTSRQTQLQHGATTITINQNEKPPTIVVKDSSNSKMNHAKIIKEVLRQYPHLVKSNKNIKLKIMPSSGDQPQKIIVKKEQLEHISSDPQSSSTSSQPQSVLRVQSSAQTLLKPLEKPQVTIHQTTPPPPVVAPKISPVQPKPSAISPASATSGTGSATISAAPAQKRRIDSKTMHALIALGAENTTGPWLCLRCGVNGRPISIPSYRGFRRHLINTHKEYIDPALCEHCGWRSSTKRELHFHMEMEHKVKTNSYTFPQCLLCTNQFLDTNALNQHMIDAHPDENKQQCIYCNKIFARELQLYNHMKTYHKKQALEDGIIDYSDDELFEQQGNTETTAPEVQDNASKDKKESKIKIISDISLPSAGALLNLESSNVATDARPQIGVSGDQQEFMETNESSIITSEPKFVTVDGNEMVLTDEQRQEIMAQLNQEHGAGGVVMVLNEPAEYTAEPTPMETSHDEMESSRGKQPNEQETGHSAGRQPEDDITDEENRNPVPESSAADEDIDDGQIYNELRTAEGRQDDSDGGAETGVMEATDDKKNSLDESKESVENLEWAENLISAHELADQEAMEAEKKDKENKSDDAINQKLKELTGDWSEDENDEDHQDTDITPATETDAPGEDTSNTVQTEDEEKDNQILKEHLKSPKNLPEKFTEPEVAEAESENLKPAEENVIPPQDSPECKNTNADDSKGEEDDLDMLMKNLHKDDGDLTDIRSPETENQGQKTDDTNAENLDVAATKTEKLETPLKEPDTDEAETILKTETEKVEKDNVAESIVEIQRDILLDELIGDDENASKEEFIKETVPAEKETLKAIGVESSTGSGATEPTKALDAMAVDDAEAKEDVQEQPADRDAFENKAEAAKDSAVISSEKTVDVIKTSERVKSLISEWAEDDEEEEQDTAVPTAITEADEEQL